jgi:phytoene dehydrogenase-like protein
MSRSPDVAIIGGGIIGCSAAAILAERGATVTVFEATAIGAGASGRNLGAIQHPFDAILAPLYHASLKHYHRLAQSDAYFDIPDQPVGVLMLNHDPDASRRQVGQLAAAVPDLAVDFVDADAVAARAVAGAWLPRAAWRSAIRIPLASPPPFARPATEREWISVGGCLPWVEEGASGALYRQTGAATRPALSPSPLTVVTAARGRWRRLAADHPHLGRDRAARPGRRGSAPRDRAGRGGCRQPAARGRRTRRRGRGRG